MGRARRPYTWSGPDATMRAVRGRPATRSAARFAVGITSLCILLIACGGTEKATPTPDDVDEVAAALSDLVYQCGSYTAGRIAEPDTTALERDVETLLAAYDRLEPDTGFEVGEGTGITRSTTLRDELRLGSRILNDGCVPELGQRLSVATDG